MCWAVSTNAGNLASKSARQSVSQVVVLTIFLEVLGSIR